MSSISSFLSIFVVFALEWWVSGAISTTWTFSFWLCSTLRIGEVSVNPVASFTQIFIPKGVS